ncbi:MAG: hypothetical protein NC912_03710 [Candidatus Omnitrophica bacterium]|nr:hypothetical protein [Candidatus Omnitrophota bacterium]
MKNIYAGFIFLITLTISSFAQAEDLLIDDFEVLLSGGKEGTVDFGSGNGSRVQVVADREVKYSGEQSIKIIYEAVAGGYMWVARGFGLDVNNSSWLITPEKIDWPNYYGFSFYMYGSNSKTKIAFDIKDDGNEMWRFIIEDNFKGWKRIICPFKEFFARFDWQPDNSDRNLNLDFPIKSFQFEPLPEAKGIVYFDKVELVRK